MKVSSSPTLGLLLFPYSLTHHLNPACLYAFAPCMQSLKIHYSTTHAINEALEPVPSFGGEKLNIMAV